MAEKQNATDGGSSDPFQADAARKGAQAEGGIDPQPGDPTSPKEAARRAAERNEAMEQDGFGDHKGGRL